MQSNSGGADAENASGTERTGGGRGRSRRRFLAATGGTAAAGLAGCVGPLSGGGEDVVTVAAVEGSGRLFQRLIEDYVEDDAGVTVDVSLFPFANLLEKSNSVLTTESDAFDVAFLSDAWFPRLAPHCAPIERWLPEDLPRDQFIDVTTDVATWPSPDERTVPSAEGMDRRLRGVVAVGNNQMYAYNRAHYEAVGESEPQTWDDVLRAGRKIDERVDGASGYVIRGKRGNPINANFFGMAITKAGDMFDRNWRYRWDEPPGLDALRFYVEDLKAISPDGVASFDSDQVLNRLGEGSAAQAPVWPSAASLLIDSDETAEADNLAFTVVPKGRRRAPLHGSWIAAINKYIDDRKKRAAGKVLRSFVSREAQNRYVQLGGIPFRHDTFRENMDVHPWFDTLYESLQTASVRPRTPFWSELVITQGQYLNSALAGEITPRRALTKINDNVENTLEKAGYYERP